MQLENMENPRKESGPNWDDLRIFYWVVKFGSISKAAESLAVSQPTLSRRIEGLESYLKAKLLERTPNGVFPTEIGTVVFNHVHMMQASVQEMTRKMDRTDDAIEGKVRIAAPDGLLTYWITPRVRDFQRAHPKLSLEFICSLDTPSIMNREADLSIQFSESKEMEAVAIPLGVAHYLPFASEEYLSIYGEPRSIQDFVSHRWIYHINQRYQSENWDEGLLALKKLVSFCYVTDSSGAMVEAVRRGLGIGMLPTYFATFERDLVLLDFEFQSQAKFWLVFHRQIGQIKRVRAVVDWMKACFNRTQMPWFADTFIHPRDFNRMKLQSLPETDRPRPEIE